MCTEAPKRIYELEHLGVPFSRLPDGRIAQRPFGGAGFPRTCYAADKTGHVILHTLYEQCLKNDVEFLNEWFVKELLVDKEIQTPSVQQVMVWRYVTEQEFPLKIWSLSSFIQQV